MEIKIDARGSSWKIAARVFAAVKDHTDIGTKEVRSQFIERMIGEHVNSFRPNVLEFVGKCASMNEGDRVTAGDLDLYLTCEANTLSQSDGHLVVSCKNACTCREDNCWLLVYSKGDTMSFGLGKAFIRKLFTNSDYKPNERSVFTERPDLRFHADRGFRIKYLKEYHPTKLGGVYGDARDAGYVADFTNNQNVPESLKPLIECQVDREIDTYHVNYQDFQAVVFDMIWLLGENPWGDS